MNAAGDLGGMMGFGPVAPEKDEPISHAQRGEGGALALACWHGRWHRQLARSMLGAMPAESLLPPDYLRPRPFARSGPRAMARL